MTGRRPLLDEKAQAKVRRLYAEEGLTQAELAERFGVSTGAIRTALGVGDRRPSAQYRQRGEG